MIASLVDHCACVENLYLRHPSAIVEKLENAIVGVYAAVMRYLAEAKRYFEQNTAGE